jgi:hypothetical protein
LTHEVVAPDLDEQVRSSGRGEFFLKVRVRPALEMLSDPRLRDLASVAVIIAPVIDPYIEKTLRTMVSARCKRLLVTASAASTQVVRLLNAGLADSLLFQDEPNFDDRLTACIERLTEDYFEAGGQILKCALHVNGAAFMDTAAASTLLAATKAKLGAHAHCVLADPPGVLILPPAGDQTFLLICDPDYVSAQGEIAALQGDGDTQPFGFAEASALAHWNEIVSSSTQLAGAEGWRTACVRRSFETDDIFRQIVERTPRG